MAFDSADAQPTPGSSSIVPVKIVVERPGGTPDVIVAESFGVEQVSPHKIVEAMPGEHVRGVDITRQLRSRAMGENAAMAALFGIDSGAPKRPTGPIDTTGREVGVIEASRPGLAAPRGFQLGAIEAKAVDTTEA